MTAKKAKARSRSRGTRQPRALALLASDHKTVAGMFRRFERLDKEDDDERFDLLHQICTALTAHATMEEELFYPELRAAVGEEDAEHLDEATVEHGSIKTLIAELEDADAEDELVSARVKVLSEYVKHHVKEEEGAIFRLAKRAKDLDLEELGERMEERKGELEATEGGDSADMRETKSRGSSAVGGRMSAKQGRSR